MRMLVRQQNQELAEEVQVRKPKDDEVAWIRLDTPDPEQIKLVLEDYFQCHPLLVEDCIKLNQRPKMDKYKNNIFIPFFAVTPDYKLHEIALIVGPNYVISVGHKPLELLDSLFEEFSHVEGRFDDSGEILYRIIDRCVDDYVRIVNHVEASVEKLENTIYRNPYAAGGKEIFRLKRTMHKLRSLFSEEKTVLGTISHKQFPYTHSEADVYFVDIYDHLSRVIDSLDISRESVTGLLELQMNMKSDRMNQIMKVLTIISSIFLPLTFIVGVYGMNFRYMPELSWPYGYPAVWCVLLSIGIGLYWYYKRRGWL